MSSEITAAIVGGIAGIVTGGISGLAAPWANWTIEKRRTDRLRRAALIERWRAGLARYTQSEYRRAIAAEDWYLSLRTYLTVDERYRTEPPPRTVIVAPDGGPPVEIAAVRSAIERLQREWKVP